MKRTSRAESADLAIRANLDHVGLDCFFILEIARRDQNFLGFFFLLRLAANSNCRERIIAPRPIATARTRYDDRSAVHHRISLSCNTHIESTKT